MKKDIGDRQFEIWLLGDSDPVNWQPVLDAPLDPRHPARHSIWTSVLEVVQDRVFRACRERVDTSTIYIRNAVQNSADKPPSNATEWPGPVEQEIADFQALLHDSKPRLLLSFGAFAFEFGRRVLQEDPRRSYGYWGAKTLGDEFRRRVDTFALSKTNLLPLLHASISRGRFMESHAYFSGKTGANYFDYAGSSIARILLEHREKLRIWIE